MEIAAGQFKTKCLKLMDDVQKYHEDIIITKFGKPIAKLTFIEDKPSKPLFGFLKNEITISEDIVRPINEQWNADE